MALAPATAATLATRGVELTPNGWAPAAFPVPPAPWELPAIIGGAVAGATTNATAGLGDVLGAVNAARNWMIDPSNWTRVAYVVGGIVLSLIGVTMLVDKAAIGTAVKLGGSII